MCNINLNKATLLLYFLGLHEAKLSFVKQRFCIGIVGLMLFASGCRENPTTIHQAVSSHKTVSFSDDELSLASLEVHNGKNAATSAVASIAIVRDFASRFQSAKSRPQGRGSKSSDGEFASLPLDEVLPELDRTFWRGGREYHLQIRCINPNKLSAQAERFGVMYDLHEFHEGETVGVRGAEFTRPSSLLIQMSDGNRQTYSMPNTESDADRLRQELNFPLFVISPTYTKSEMRRVVQESQKEFATYFGDHPFVDAAGNTVFKASTKKGNPTKPSADDQKVLIELPPDDGQTSPYPPGFTLTYRAISLVRLRINFQHDWNWFDGTDEVEMLVGQDGLPFPRMSRTRNEIPHHQLSNYTLTERIGYVVRENVDPNAPGLKVHALEDDEQAYFSRIGIPFFSAFLQQVDDILTFTMNRPSSGNFLGVKFSNDPRKVTKIINDAAARLGAGTRVFFTTFRQFDFATLSQVLGIDGLIHDGPGLFHSDDLYGGTLPTNPLGITDSAIGITERNVRTAIAI